MNNIVEKLIKGENLSFAESKDLFADLMEGKLNQQWKNLMAFELDRARSWFTKSESGVRLLSADARWPVWTSLRLYRGILNSIENLDYDVFNNRAFVGKWKKIIDLPIAFIISQYR